MSGALAGCSLLALPRTAELSLSSKPSILWNFTQMPILIAMKDLF